MNEINPSRFNRRGGDADQVYDHLRRNPGRNAQPNAKGPDAIRISNKKTRNVSQDTPFKKIDFQKMKKHKSKMQNKKSATNVSRMLKWLGLAAGAIAAIGLQYLRNVNVNDKWKK